MSEHHILAFAVVAYAGKVLHEFVQWLRRRL